MKVGDPIWLFNVNRRVYTREPGRPYGGGLIYREHWEVRKITGETSRSWLVARWERDTKPTKVPKKGLHPGWAFTQQEVDLDCWLHEHRVKILREAERASDLVLIKVARVLGYPDLPDVEEP